MNKKGFTLIELLVVVLIIGILAAIAVPKYQVAVVKSEYSTLKAKTRAIAESVNRYILAKGEYPKQFSELDISLPDTNWCSKASQGDDLFYCSFNKGGSCMVWVNGQYKVACSLKGKRMYFHFNSNTLKPMYCETNITDEAATKVCLQETGKKKEQTVWCSGELCLYNY